MFRALNKLAAPQLGEKTGFVVVSVAMNLVLLGRAFVTMQVLDYRELGIAALLQAAIMLIGMFQLGFINGGYRLLCSASDAEAVDINGQVYVFFVAVGATVCLGAIAIMLVGDDEGARLLAPLGAVGGIATLVRTWMTNQFIARANLRRLNHISIASNLASLAMLAFIPVDPLAACLAAIVVQPLAFVGFAVLRDRSLLPDRLIVSRRLVREVLAAGFLTFVTGILLQANSQLERWYVGSVLGLDALGHLYLATLFVTLFQMVPVALDQAFLPPIVRAHSGQDRAGVRERMRQYALVTAVYCLTATLAVAVLARPVVGLLLPRYVGDLRYLYLSAPGVILLAAAGPMSLMFSALIRYRTYVVSYATGTALTGAAFGIGLLSGQALSLDLVMMVRSGANAAIAVLILIGFAIVSREFPEFRPFARSLR